MASTRAPQIVFHVEKVKSVHALREMSKHWDRSGNPQNADPAALVNNRQLVGSNSADDVMALLPANKKSNSVLAMEVIMSASPSYFRPDEPARAGRYDQARVDAYVEATMGWAKKEFGKRLVSAVLHLDETTPHIHLAVVPLGEKGQLNAKGTFNRAALIRFQDEISRSVAHLGIKRGTPKSQATHERIQDHYRAVNEAGQSLEIGAADRARLVRGETPQVVKDLQAKAGDQQKSRQEAEEARLLAASQSAAADLAKQTLRATQDRLRAIPIADVLPLLGYERDPNDTTEGWKGPAGRLSQGVRAGTPEKFFLHDMDVGGGGAIDLVMKVDNRDFKDAVAWLASQFGDNQAIATLTAKTESDAKEQVPLSRAKVVALKTTEEPAHLEAVKKYLVEERKIPDPLVSHLIKFKNIQAAESGRFINAAFPLVAPTDLGEPGSAERKVGLLLRGTQPEHPFHGVRGEKAIWGFRMNANKEAARNVMVIGESPIDVMSVVQVRLQKKGLFSALEKDDIAKIYYAATGGSSRDQLQALTKHAVSKGMQIFTAFDDDGPGRTLHARVDETAKDASPDAVVTNLSKFLTMMNEGIRDFNQLWMLLLRVGAENLKLRIDTTLEAAKQREAREKAALATKTLLARSVPRRGGGMEL